MLLFYFPSPMIMIPTDYNYMETRPKQSGRGWKTVVYRSWNEYATKRRRNDETVVYTAKSIKFSRKHIICDHVAAKLLYMGQTIHGYMSTCCITYLPQK